MSCTWRRSGVLFSCALAVVAGAGSSFGQVTQSTGADVIVGDLPSVYHWGSLNGIEAYSVGTTSCNMGDTPLNWLASPNPNHPCIGQTLYRYATDADGVPRFEQLGQSWLKHGFTALQGSVCTSEFGFPCQATAGTTLGVGCSDPYGASLNGGQGGLGPKSEVNAATAVNQQPHSTPADSSVLGGRIQVADTDLDVAGARFFVEGQYMSADDAAAGNDDNNASYREVVLGSGYALNAIGATHRREAAILAWGDIDPSVVVQNIDVPNDGRFTVAYKVTDLGNGLYDYDYAIYNMNSDRSGQSVSIPLPGGITIASSAFHDVNYHSGEPYDNTDWTINNTGSALVFASTSTYASNPNGNALRWGTTYNFRFQANAAPTTGVVTLNLFKPGTPTSMSIVAAVPSGSVSSNDDCANAIPLSYGSFPFDTSSATTDGGPDPLCDSSSYADINQDIWYRMSADCDGDYTVSTCGSGYDTKIAVYADGCPGSGGTIVACNDDSCGLQSSITFSGVGGTDYYIRVGGYTGASGSGTLTISGPPCLPVPANDTCAGAAPIVERSSLGGTTLGAFADGSASCGSNSDPDVYYAFNPTATNDYDIILNGGTISSPVLSVLDGCGGAEVACSTTGSLTTTLSGGGHYFIRVASPTGSEGSFSLLVRGAILNDDCSGALPVYDGVPVNGSTTDATGSDITSCTYGDATDVWYTYTPANSATVTIQTCGGTTNYDTALAVFSSCGGSQLACNDDYCGLQSRVVVSMAGGVTYYIRVSGYGGNTGDFTLSVTGGNGTPPPEPPANDDCFNRIGISYNGTTDPIDTTGATDGTGPADDGCGPAGADIWFGLASQPADGQVTISTCSSNYDTILSVYDDSDIACNNLPSRLIACDNDSCGLQSQLTIDVQVGRVYTIRVAGYNGATGTAIVDTSFTPAPSCPCETDGDDAQVNVFDLLAYLADWFPQNGQSGAGLSADYNNSGNVDVFDLLDYLSCWFPASAGNPCP